MSENKTIDDSVGSLNGNISFNNPRPLVLIHEVKTTYEERLAGIVCDSQCPPHELKSAIYQEYVDNLSNVIQTLLETLQELEDECTNRICLLEAKLHKSCPVEHNSELRSTQHDLRNLLELIRRAIVDRSWSVDGLEFETITKDDIFGDFGQRCKLALEQKKVVGTNQSKVDALDEKIRKLECQLEEANGQLRCLEEENDSLKTEICRQKLTVEENECLKEKICQLQKKIDDHDKSTDENLKALAVEVAAKYDEIQELKTQICTLDNEIQNAHKKIQLKDNVNKALRSDLRRCSQCKCTGLPPKDSPRLVEVVDLTTSGTQMTSRSTGNRSETSLETVLEGDLDKLRSLQIVEKDGYMKNLQDELGTLFDLIKANNANMQTQKEIISTQQCRIVRLVQELATNLSKEQMKVSFLHNELLRIERCSETDFNDSVNECNEELETERKLMQSVWNRIDCMQQDIQGLQKELQKKEIALQEANTNLCTKTAIIEKNGQIIKDVANTITTLCSTEIPFEPLLPDQFLHECSTRSNPLCDAIRKLHATAEKQKLTIMKLTDDLRCNQGRECGEVFELKKENATLEDALDQVNSELCHYKQTSTTSSSSSFNDLLDSKIRLENECKNQLATIQNLREALECCKRGEGDQQQPGSSSSIWNWWTGSDVHNV